MNIAIIGGGPAGLRAAEIAAAGGATVTLYDAKASIGRKFLVAGRGGLNLTKAEPRAKFATRYTGPGQRRGEMDGAAGGGRRGRDERRGRRNWASRRGSRATGASILSG